MKLRHCIGYALVVATALPLAGCLHRTAAVECGAKAYEPKFACNFEIYSTEGASTIIEVKNPWQGAEAVTKRIFVARYGEKAPEGFVGETVAADPKRVVCFSSSHVAFIDALGLTDRIVGISAGGYVSNPTVAKGYADGTVREVGYDANVDYELLVALHPDAAFIYGTSGENTALTSKLRELHIPALYVADYVEQTPLGKSEWLRFFGEIFNAADAADETFDAIAERYEGIRIAALKYDTRPSVMFNAPYRDVWFVPSDDSYMVRLVGDAGGSYVCGGTKGNRSRALSAESAYLYASRADVWLNPNSARTMAQLKAENPKFTAIPAVLHGRVYNSTARQTPAGGSDFWESGALRADLVLADLAALLHPDDEHELYYFEHLE